MDTLICSHIAAAVQYVGVSAPLPVRVVFIAASVWQLPTVAAALAGTKQSRCSACWTHGARAPCCIVCRLCAVARDPRPSEP